MSNIALDLAYDILQSNLTMSRSEVRANYRRLARDEHPDMGGDAGRFRVIAKALEVVLTERVQNPTLTDDIDGIFDGWMS